MDHQETNKEQGCTNTDRYQRFVFLRDRRFLFFFLCGLFLCFFLRNDGNTIFHSVDRLFNLRNQIIRALCIELHLFGRIGDRHIVYALQCSQFGFNLSCTVGAVQTIQNIYFCFRHGLRYDGDAVFHSIDCLFDRRDQIIRTSCRQLHLLGRIGDRHIIYARQCF